MSGKRTFEGPLRVFEEDFRLYLLGLGYSELSVVLRVNLLAHLGRWMAGEGLAPGGLDEAAIERFVAVRQETHVDLARVGDVGRVVDFLRSRSVIPERAAPLIQDFGAVDGLLREWSSYLWLERSLATSTVERYGGLVRPFLESMEHEGVLDPSGFTASDVHLFMGKALSGSSPSTGKYLVTAMRSLLGYLYVTGRLGHPLVGAVLGCCLYRDAGLPRWLPADEVAAMIDSCDLATVGGRRDRAIMAVISRLGLRAGEVSKLTLDDVGWRAGTLRVEGKGGYTDLMPIPTDVGQALMEHLTGAPAPPLGERGLFLRLRAPIRPLTSAGVKSVVRAAATRAGYDAVGSHRLRHTVATATLNAGATLEEVSQLLRHRSLASTTIYAKVDLAHLSLIARPWPVANAGTDTPPKTRAMRPRKINPVPTLTAEQVATLMRIARPWPSSRPASLKEGIK